MPEWYVISLRPQGQHAGVRRAALRHRAGVIALSPWKLVPQLTPAALAALDAALACDATVFTSPAAARAAAQLAGTLSPRRAVAVGAGTRSTLQRLGVAEAHAPTRMDSEGVLSLRILQHARRVGVVTAPGGRDLIASSLTARGVEVVRAEVYRREAVALSPRGRAQLAQLSLPGCVLASSGQALSQGLISMTPAEQAQLRTWPLVASSQRVAVLAEALGFSRLRLADGPRPAQLMATAAHWHSQRFR